MGLLDGDGRSKALADRKRRDVLRASIKKMADDQGVSYDRAVEIFAKQIDRKKPTVYSWLTDGFSGKGSMRPLPPQHYTKLVEAGFLDPTLVSENRRP